MRLLVRGAVLCPASAFSRHCESSSVQALAVFTLFGIPLKLTGSVQWKC